MKYPIAIEPVTKKNAWGVVVPDLPGCFSAGDSGLDEAIDQALLSDEIERINITLLKTVLARLDAKAKKAGESRSAFIAHLALTA